MLLARAACLVHPHATMDTTLLSQSGRKRARLLPRSLVRHEKATRLLLPTLHCSAASGSEAQATWSSWTLQGWCMYSECCDFVFVQAKLDRSWRISAALWCNQWRLCVYYSKLWAEVLCFFLGWKRMRERKCEGNVPKRRQKFELFSLWCFSFLLLFLKMMCFFFCVLLEKFVARDLVVRIKFASFI
jgi:hypothetical protein